MVADRILPWLKRAPLGLPATAAVWIITVPSSVATSSRLKSALLSVDLDEIDKTKKVNSIMEHVAVDFPKEKFQKLKHPLYSRGFKKYYDKLLKSKI